MKKNEIMIPFDFNLDAPHLHYQVIKTGFLSEVNDEIMSTISGFQKQWDSAKVQVEEKSINSKQFEKIIDGLGIQIGSYISSLLGAKLVRTKKVPRPKANNTAE